MKPTREIDIWAENRKLVAENKQLKAALKKVCLLKEQERIWNEETNT